jgi:leucyl/phenylalanyl-tRNA--protein transferase
MRSDSSTRQLRGDQSRGPDQVRAPVVLQPNDVHFPAPETALREPNGLLAIGGDLSVERLLAAYDHGIFPWFDSDQGPILWWSPDPRAVVAPDAIRVSRSLRRTIARATYHVSLDTAFAAVIAACAGPRRNATGTWITPRMQLAYRQLYELGYAHSVEAWQDGRLAGGLYGVALGRMFFGESMFSHARDASKVAFVYLSQHLHARGYRLIDCQVMNPHLESLGAVEMPRREFLEIVRQNRQCATTPRHWDADAA